MTEEIEIPSGINCELIHNTVKCKKGSVELSRTIDDPAITTKIENNKIILNILKGNRNQHKTIQSYIRHFRNLFSGLDNKFVYKLQSANVHFPMTIKVAGSIVTIDNFIGEKTPRKAKILPGVTVEIKGQDITVSSHNKEAAGHTVANLEKATKIRKKDRRIFQDGIYLVSKPEGNK